MQVDADGQHDLGDVPLLLSRATHNPDALILAVPQFDASIPRSRRYGRHLTHLWVWINTLSLDVTDSMCGFRVYPIEPLLALAATEPLGSRMDFDTEVVVRLHWRGIPIVEVPTQVLYPRGGGCRISGYGATTCSSPACMRACFSACCADCRNWWRGDCGRPDTHERRATLPGRDQPRKFHSTISTPPATCGMATTRSTWSSRAASCSKQFNYNYDAMTQSGYLWPVVDLQLRFLRPLRFGDRVKVRASLEEWEYRLRIEYLIRNAATGERLTKASTVQVAVSAASGEMCLRSPDILFARLGVPA